MSIPGEPVCRSFHAVAIGTELIRRHQGNVYSETSEGAPQLIMTYTALLFLAILRDDFFSSGSSRSHIVPKGLPEREWKVS